MGFGDFLNDVFTGIETVFPGLKEERRPNDPRDVLEAAERHRQQCEQFQREFEASRRGIERDGRLIRNRVEEAFREADEEEQRAREAAREAAIARPKRIRELKEAFEKSGRRHNSAEPEDVETLLTLTAKKIIQQCRRSKCHGCKLGWICPKYWAESQ